MYKNLPKIALFSSLLLVVGCDKIPGMGLGGKSKIECSDPNAKNLVIESLQKSINSSAKGYAASFDKPTSGASIRASVNQLKMNLDNIRTTQDDPQSTKNFCKGTLTVTVPSKLIQNADITREYNGEYDVKEDAYQQDLELDANTVNYEIEYSVQPTDDGEVIFVESQNGNDLSTFLAYVVVDADQKNNVKGKKVVEAKQEAKRVSATQSAADSAAAAAASALAATAAEQAKVKAEMDYKRSEFNKLWGKASKEAQASIEYDQKEWVEWRDQVCVDEARGAEPARQEIVRMQCITRLLSDRYYEVKEYFDNY
ncbi:lysozyme inhibitor LprI family protein [Psychrobacter sanguinis]|jgi:hypothetical protein|uniref:lysozyme inhibitor LprI family protein n=1 Tax=Psychrobacter sanguinis TaxID=861445 RepID=UPI00020C9DEE|nr:lysozyme inhibitor LprI family protein [Psychrobacter sanguinis]EGK08813.1 hypothetical protein HMPREF9373_2297 [Psychrobacter sp. 1501(2011)]MCD9152233.1 DUF1311 domain-containing protein [Psychrobacter sanguinis]